MLNFDEKIYIFFLIDTYLANSIKIMIRNFFFCLIEVKI